MTLPEWYKWGLRAITVGFQGGMPVLTIENSTIDCNPFYNSGLSIDQSYLSRMDRIIRAADKLGLLVIVSILYQGQSFRMGNGIEILNSVCTASEWLKDQNYTNVIIEVANEHTVGAFGERPLVCSPDGISTLIKASREASGGFPVGASGGGAKCFREVADASDVILVHGNGSGRQKYAQFIKRIRSWELNKPIVCNEDSPCFTRLDIAFDTCTSWGYYNTHTKQEPPSQWGIANAEDVFFTRRMAKGLGITVETVSENDRYVLLGLNDFLEHEGKRWIRLSAEEPETVRSVEFYKNDDLIDIAYEEPFYVGYQNTWMHEGTGTAKGDIWKAIVHLCDGNTISRQTVQE